MLIIGDKEMQDNEVSVRSRNDGDKGAIPFADFLRNISKEIKEKTI